MKPMVLWRYGAEVLSWSSTPPRGLDHEPLTPTIQPHAPQKKPGTSPDTQENGKWSKVVHTLFEHE